MSKNSFVFFFLLFCFSCSEETDNRQVNGNIPTEYASDIEMPISYSENIHPIFENKCVACHACYDSPCQLNLASAEGLERGANKKNVYNSKRLEAAAPTRLYIDALDKEAWEKQGFYSVIESSGSSASLLLNMLELGRQHPHAGNQLLDESIETGIVRENVCPVTDEFEQFAKKYPRSGMPYGATGLTEKEFEIISSWLHQGAKIDKQEIKLGQAETGRIQKWEAFLNQDEPRQKLVSRYLYEHLFIAHLYFSELGTSNFFQLVRSSSPPGKKIIPIATARPNDDPGQKFWYRFLPVKGSIVYKTHITYELNQKRLHRFQELFFKDDWELNELPAYSIEERSNPFTTFSAIPARARYQFMLDDAEYFVRTFIRGPVCHGQIATDVIRDRFWNLFESPDTDIYVNNAAYRADVSKLLAVPGVEDDVEDFLPQWLDYRSRNKSYLKKRQHIYHTLMPEGPGINDLWDGDGHKPDALQTIFRHHNNAAIHTGLIGNTPKTIWVMDYALFERSYYVLVVNFNVFGNIAHQTLTRLYFDLIRNGAEQNFLRLMPRNKRKEMIKSWYQNTGKLKLFLTYDQVGTDTPTAIAFKTSDPKSELKNMIEKAMPDIPGETKVKKGFEKSNEILNSLASKNTLTLPAIKFMPDISFLRVYDEKNNRQIYSLVRDREHSNVAFMLGEELRYIPEEDSLTVFPDILGSYPNFMFNVSLSDVEEFRHHLYAIQTEEQFTGFVAAWGVRRSHPDFWELFHDLTDFIKETDASEAGVLDMNRYENL